MLRRNLGASGLAISPIGIGTWAIGGAGWEFGWGAQDDTDSLAALERAVDLGVNWLDTAAVYGLGHAEEIVGLLVRQIPPSRRPMIFTKGSLIWDAGRRVSHSLNPQSLALEVDASLRRLNVDTIDLYQIHWPAFPPCGPDDGIEDALDQLGRLKQAGKLRAIGVSNFNVQQLERARAVIEISSLQPPYSILKRGVESEVIPYCKRTGIGLITYSTLQSGLLTGVMTKERISQLSDDDWRKTRSADFQEPRLTQNLSMVDRLRKIGERHGVGVAVVAIAWVLRKPCITGAIIGVRRPSHVDGIIAASEFRLTDDEIEELSQ